LRKDIDLVEKSLQLIGSFDDWNLVAEADDIATFSKGAGTEFFVRAEMILDVPIFPVLALFSEVDLYPDWISQIGNFQSLGETTPFRKLVYYTTNLPAPLTSRDVAMNAIGMAIPANKSALIIMRTFDEPFLGIENPQES
jgi:hypothetical protein